LKQPRSTGSEGNGRTTLDILVLFGRTYGLHLVYFNCPTTTFAINGRPDGFTYYQRSQPVLSRTTGSFFPSTEGSKVPYLCVKGCYFPILYHCSLGDDDLLPAWPTFVRAGSRVWKAQRYLCTCSHGRSCSSDTHGIFGQ